MIKPSLIISALLFASASVAYAADAPAPSTEGASGVEKKHDADKSREKAEDKGHAEKHHHAKHDNAEGKEEKEDKDGRKQDRAEKHEHHEHHDHADRPAKPEQPGK
jgi:hypothetical protein